MKSDLGAVHDALTAAGVGIIGLSLPTDVHDTHGPATFIRCGARLYRVDWATEPTADQVELAASRLGVGCAVIGAAPVPIQDTRAFIPPPDLDG